MRDYAVISHKKLDQYVRLAADVVIGCLVFYGFR